MFTLVGLVMTAVLMFILLMVFFLHDTYPEITDPTRFELLCFL